MNKISTTIERARDELSATMIAFEETIAPEDKPLKRAQIVNALLTSSLHALLSAVIEEVEGMREKPKCNRQNGCGLPFRQGVDCYDGQLCEDVSVPSERNKTLDALSSTLKEALGKI